MSAERVSHTRATLTFLRFSCQYPSSISQYPLYLAQYLRPSSKAVFHPTCTNLSLETSKCMYLGLVSPFSLSNMVIRLLIQ